MELTTYNLVDKVVYITLNRPEKRNALNQALVSALSNSIERAQNDLECKVIVLKGEGKAFCAGADLDYLQGLQKNTLKENEDDSRELMQLFQLIHASPKIVIAQIEGHAIAGGCGLASLADFSFSVPSARFGYTEVKIGFVPAIVMVYLIRKIGEGKAREILLSGNVFTAAKAKEIGLINYVCQAETIEKEVQQFAHNLISNNSRQSMATVKEMMIKVQDMPLDEALEYAVKSNARARETEDCKKGIQAFLNKEEIKWD
jgi:methylglutaconyl-CoA hydratase